MPLARELRQAQLRTDARDPLAGHVHANARVDRLPIGQAELGPVVRCRRQAVVLLGELPNIGQDQRVNVQQQRVAGLGFNL